MSAEFKISPLFLSTRAYTEALRIYDAFVRGDKDAKRRSLDRAVHELSQDGWEKYDETYLSLYTLSLYNNGNFVRLLSDKALSDLPNRGAILFMLDIDLRVEENRYKLLDERGVAVFMNFKSAIEGWVPFEMVPKMLGFGCIVIEFEVMLPDLSDLRSPSTMANTAFSDGGLIPSLFTGPDWESLRKRFNISEVAVSKTT